MRKLNIILAIGVVSFLMSMSTCTNTNNTSSNASVTPCEIEYTGASNSWIHDRVASFIPDVESQYEPIVTISRVDQYAFTNQGILNDELVHYIFISEGTPIIGNWYYFYDCSGSLVSQGASLSDVLPSTSNFVKEIQL